MSCLSRILTTAVALVFATTAALAQDYPTRPIHSSCPTRPGGSTDLIARAVAEPLRERLGQPVIVENRVGGGGVVGLEAGRPRASRTATPSCWVAPIT